MCVYLFGELHEPHHFHAPIVEHKKPPKYFFVFPLLLYFFFAHINEALNPRNNRPKWKLSLQILLLCCVSTEALINRRSRMKRLYCSPCQCVWVWKPGHVIDTGCSFFSYVRQHESNHEIKRLLGVFSTAQDLKKEFSVLAFLILILSSLGLCRLFTHKQTLSNMPYHQGRQTINTV